MILRGDLVQLTEEYGYVSKGDYMIVLSHKKTKVLIGRTTSVYKMLRCLSRVGTIEVHYSNVRLERRRQ